MSRNIAEQSVRAGGATRSARGDAMLGGHAAARTANGAKSCERPASSGTAREPGAPLKLSILGATGSVGTSTLDLVERAPAEFEVVALTAGRNVEALARAARQHSAKLAVIADPDAYGALKAALSGSGIAVAAGDSGLDEAAAAESDLVMAAIVGAAGLKPTLTAIECGRRVALANKECLVCAGDVFMRAVARNETILLPVDSEHSAAFQSLDGTPRDRVEKVTLTASGGPFRTMAREDLAAVTPQEALRHPNWSMGPKITIDSATLMNKGLELIEAYHLFQLRPDQLDVIVHPQSVVHCLVAYSDGSVLAQMAMPDMRTPIAYALAWPERMQAPTPRLDLATLGRLDFEAPDHTRFPALQVALDALGRGGASCTVLNAANEVAVAAFLDGAIGFTAIPRLVSGCLARAEQSGMLTELPDLAAVLATDAQARALAHELLPRYR